MPADPLQPFLFLNQLQICSAEKKVFEKMRKLCPPLFEISRYATAHPIVKSKACKHRETSSN